MTKIPEIEQALSDYKKARNEARKNLNKLKQIGEIKFSNRAMQRACKSEAPR